MTPHTHTHVSQMVQQHTWVLPGHTSQEAINNRCTQAKCVCDHYLHPPPLHGHSKAEAIKHARPPNN